MDRTSVDRTTPGGTHSLPADPRAEILEAARSALRLLDLMDAHAPEGFAFGGEGRVRRQLREAIRRADGPLAPGPQDYEDSERFEAAQAVYEQEVADGRTMSSAERCAFEAGFLGAGAEIRSAR